MCSSVQHRMPSKNGLVTRLVDRSIECRIFTTLGNRSKLIFDGEARVQLLTFEEHLEYWMSSKIICISYNMSSGQLVSVVWCFQHKKKNNKLSRLFLMR